MSSKIPKHGAARWSRMLQTSGAVKEGAGRSSKRSKARGRAGQMLGPQFRIGLGCPWLSHTLEVASKAAQVLGWNSGLCSQRVSAARGLQRMRAARLAEGVVGPLRRRGRFLEAARKRPRGDSNPLASETRLPGAARLTARPFCAGAGAGSYRPGASRRGHKIPGR